MRTEKYLDTCQHKIKFVLTFLKNDQASVEICTVALCFGSDICQIKADQPQNCLENVSDVRLLFHALHMEHKDCIII